MLDKLSDIIHTNNKYAFFVGAGISKNSGLPLAGELMNYIINSLTKGLEVDEEDIKQINVSTIQFELFIQTLFEYNVSPKMYDFFKNGYPNNNHKFIAKMCKSGYAKTILTTNFDMLIEKALDDEGVKYKVYYSDEHFENIDFDENSVKLIKIHGSIENEESLITLMHQVLDNNAREIRRPLIEHVFKNGNHDAVLIVGYSNSDKFDIIEVIENIENSDIKVYYVNHTNDDNIYIENMNWIIGKWHDNPYKKFKGNIINGKTDGIVKEFWTNLLDDDYITGSNYNDINWKEYIDKYIGKLNKWEKYTILGAIFNNIRYYGLSKKYFEKAISCSNEKNYSEYSRSLVNTSAAMLEELNLKYDKKKGNDIKNKLNDALEIFKDNNDIVGECIVYLNLGKLNRITGDNIKKLKIKRREYRKSLKHYEKCDKKLQIIEHNYKNNFTKKWIINFRRNLTMNKLVILGKLKDLTTNNEDYETKFNALYTTLSSDKELINANFYGIDAIYLYINFAKYEYERQHYEKSFKYVKKALNLIEKMENLTHTKIWRPYLKMHYPQVPKETLKEIYKSIESNEILKNQLLDSKHTISQLYWKIIVWYLLLSKYAIDNKLDNVENFEKYLHILGTHFDELIDFHKLNESMFSILKKITPNEKVVLICKNVIYIIDKLCEHKYTHDSKYQWDLLSKYKIPAEEVLNELKKY